MADQLPERADDRKWGACAENALIKSSTGALIGGLAAFLLFRGAGVRAAVTGFGGGVGAGIGWMDCRFAFEHQARVNTYTLGDVVPQIFKPLTKAPEKKPVTSEGGSELNAKALDTLAETKPSDKKDS